MNFKLTHNNRKRFSCIGMLLLLSVATVKTLASDFPEWQQDCVGRMAISLPNDAEIAVVQTRSMLDISNESRISFQDGLPASYSNFLIRGEMRISAPLNARELATFLTEANKLREKILKAAQKDKEQDPSDQEGNVSEYPLGDRQGIALHRGYTSLVAFTLKNHAITWLSVSNANSKFDAPRFVASLISDLQLRPNFSVPVSSGICLPHLLLPVSQSQTRRIGTTYRLKSHPDITIFLEDHTARKPGKYERPEVFTAIYKSNYFWTQRYQDYDSIENLLKFRRHNNIPFAGQRAVESKVRMIRTDKITEDFGYLVVTQGNPDAKVDAPDLMLYVIRDARQAIKRGIKPVPKKEFFKLARQIADSVKHRGATPSEK